MDDPRFHTNEARLQHPAALEPLIEEILGQSDRRTVEARLAESDVPFGSLNEVDSLVDHPQLAARDALAGGRQSGRPDQGAGRSAEPVGHAEARRPGPGPWGSRPMRSRGELGYTDDEIVGLHEAGAI